MSFPLAIHAHLAIVDDDIVLLDIAADRYLCVPSGRALLRPDADLGGVSPTDPGVVDALRAAGLLGETRATAREVPARPVHDLAADGRAPLTLRDGRRLLGAVCDLLVRYRGRPLRRIVGFAATRAVPVTPADTAEVFRLARLYRRVVAWLPLPRKCLIRRFVLLRLLQRSGLGARWVFGVRTWPFSAHCWIQVGDVALDDFAERLVAYEPIFAVG